MITEAGKVRDKGGYVPVGRNAKDSAALKLPAFGDIEVAFMKRDPGPRAVSAAGGDLNELATAIKSQKTRLCPHFAVGVTGFDDARIALTIKSHARRKR